MITQTDKIVWLTDMDGDWLKIRVKNPRAICENLREGKTYDVEVKLHREKRSLDANAYFHVLVNLLAKKCQISDDEMKRNLVLMYGTIATDTSGKAIGAILPEGTDITDFYDYARWYKTKDVGGKICDCYVFYKQTHKMDSAEFSRLLDGTIQECKNLGIETLPPDKVRGMMEEYAERDKGQADQA